MNGALAAAVAAAALLVPFEGAAPERLPGPPAVTPERLPGPPAVTLDHALDGERSLLAFLPENVAGGRFTVVAGGRYDGWRPAHRHRGVFWRTDSGNAYTRVAPYDTALVRRLVDPVAERARAARWKPGVRATAMAPLAEPERYGGDEFQYSFEWLVYELALRATHGNALVRGFKPECDEAMTEHERASRAAVAELRPAFVPSAGDTETWTIDAVTLRAATRATRHATDLACNSQRDDLSGDDRPPVVVTRSPRGLRVTTDSDTTAVETRWVVRVRPGPVGPPPAVPDPAPAFDPLHDYLLAVNACRALPWEYSNFAAGNIYESPREKTHLGPSTFTTEWFCERDVPASERTED